MQQAQVRCSRSCIYGSLSSEELERSGLARVCSDGFRSVRIDLTADKNNQKCIGSTAT